jgi:hypothetical protein
MPNPTLEVHTSDEADIVNGDSRFKLSGPRAAGIIAIYQHCRDHADTGPADAALFLWGVIEGLHYSWLAETENMLKIARQRTAPRV